MIPSVYSLTKESFESTFADIPKYRFEQICKWRSEGCESFLEYRNLDKKSIEALCKTCCVFSSKVLDEKGNFDSKKILVEMEDGEVVECVYMTDSKEQRTVCISSQVGCACGCKFCATGTLGFKRNLKDYEIIEQYYHLKRLFGRVDKIVFMGMGEPLLNIESLVSAVRFFKENEKISPRRITISAVGIASGIKKLADCELGIKLTLSLVTANQKERENIMPAAKANTLDELKKALLYFQKHDNRRITLAYCMLKGVNMAEKNVRELVDFSHSLVSHINLIPWNEVGLLEFKSPSAADISNFKVLLDRAHLKYSVRYSKGSSIDAACGQLVANRNKKLYNKT